MLSSDVPLSGDKTWPSEFVAIKSEPPLDIVDDFHQHKQPGISGTVIESATVTVKDEGPERDVATGLQEYRCDHCPKTYTIKSSLYYHQRKSHGTTPGHKNTAFCNVCNKHLEWKKITSHKRICHANVKPHVCDQCGQSYRERELLDDHIALKHGGRPRYECEFCLKQFFSRDKYSKHRPRKHPTEYRAIRKKMVPANRIYYEADRTSSVSFKCASCGTNFPIHQELEKHIVTEHPGTIVYSCELCGGVCSTKASFVDHCAVKHSIDIRYDCDLCGEETNNEKAFNEHCLELHPDEYAQLVQNIKLQSTAKKPTKKKNMCVECDRTFYSRKNLLDHEASIHSGKPRYECSICQTQYFHDTELSRHRKSEAHLAKVASSMNGGDCAQSSPKKTHPCKQCDVRCHTKRALVKHIALNHGGHYKCKYCEKTFFQEKTCYLHTKTHHSEQMHNLYDCIKCDKKYSSKALLEDHFSKDHLGKPRYECEFCGQQFFMRALYYKHRKTAHKEQYADLVGAAKCTLNQLYSINGCVVIKNEVVTDE
ncbi:zinc finger protein 665-like [Uranotaenia lowii]|uniref:zinc finger protein 665-like n=1 Tax=Uranotaenia lowii TaxID=190385 RepID=UPI002478EAF6|nr:zinc finger protein 665-like [Uranotaenia lowii]